jgi:8-oxo-dGTP pyrophosphatase MutT (NUDIX family)
MSIEKSAGAIIFRKEKNNAFFLLLHYQSGAKRPKTYWDLPKGHIEKGEKPEETARREIKEETGIENIEFIPEFKENIKYFFRVKNKTIFKTVVFYLVKTKDKKVIISSEHIGSKWLTYKKALKELTYKNAKDILKKANDFISK